MGERRRGARFIREVGFPARLASEADSIHVYPTFGRAHDTEHGTSCWCQPERDREEPRVIVHRPEQ